MLTLYCYQATPAHKGLEYAEQLRLSGLLNDEEADEEAVNSTGSTDYMEFLHVYRHWILG